MTEFRDLAAEVMDLAREFSPKTNPAMRRRKEALKEMALIAQDWLKAWQPNLVTTLHLDAEDGGQVGGVSPVAWMRVFSKTKSPSATAGFYVAYLFDVIGRNLFLSLNQGTSEYRAGQWRPMSDRKKVADNAATARFTLEQSGVDMAWGSTEPIDLAAQTLRDQGLFVSRDPVDRARNYELGNVLSKSYRRESLPPDDQLKQDLLDSISSLIVLYDHRMDASTSVAKATRMGLGRLSAPERVAVELRSMEITRQHFEGDGWAVENVSPYRPYDLECTKSKRVLHVEVKGTTASDLRQIELTTNEVNHCRSNPTMELALVTGIRIETDASGQPTGKDGELSFVVPWKIEDERLRPIKFAYELPPNKQWIKRPR